MKSLRSGPSYRASSMSSIALRAQAQVQKSQSALEKGQTEDFISFDEKAAVALVRAKRNDDELAFGNSGRAIRLDTPEGNPIVK